MEISDRQKNAEELVANPREALAIEIKQWISPDSIEGQAKIVIALFALRNTDGGWLLIGFDNKTLKSISDQMPQTVRETFHPDKIQTLVSKYASELFEIETVFVTREDITHPAIFVPKGIKTPVACKREMRQSDGKSYFKRDDIFVRTLQTNGIVSSARLPYEELPSLMSRCFDNRENDTAHLLSKVFRNLDKNTMDKLIAFSNIPKVPDKALESAKSFLMLGNKHFDEAKILKSRKAPDIGTMEVSLVISGDIPKQSKGRDFMSMISAANPNLTGWPIWLDSSPFYEESTRPYTRDGRWEALVTFESEGPSSRDHLDFMIFDPLGKFYLLRGFQDDLQPPERFKSGTLLDPFLMLIRIAEAFSVGQAFAKAMGCSKDSSSLYFYFRWNKLKGRILQSWANPMVMFRGSGFEAQDNTASEHVSLSIDADEQGIADAVLTVVSPLFHCFNGYEIKAETAKIWVDRLLSRKL